MKQDKQENNDDKFLVEYNTNDSLFLNSLVVNLPFHNFVVGGNGIKDDTPDYEKMNRVIYL
ncbi:hypothetical protein KAW18_03780 [candidate division WOR-3 bacterium]|nr:hypothetical protein [Candidatus Parcubacteria bacterium]MCK4526467.1 hypothetical protein [candidate division WOR-3 bacterium]